MNDESRYLLVQNVPALGVTKDLLDQLALYGNIEEWVLPHCVLYDDVMLLCLSLPLAIQYIRYQHLDEYPCEEHTDVYWIKYVDINDARWVVVCTHVIDYFTTERSPAF